MAMSLFNKYIQKGCADSRGTEVETEGMSLIEFGANNTILALQEIEQIDGRHLKSIQIQKEDLDVCDVVIIMSEPNNTPDWLEHSTKTERWDIPDTKSSDYETTVIVFNDLKKRIIERF